MKPKALVKKPRLHGGEKFDLNSPNNNGGGGRGKKKEQPAGARGTRRLKRLNVFQNKRPRKDRKPVPGSDEYGRETEKTRTWARCISKKAVP